MNSPSWNQSTCDVRKTNIKQIKDSDEEWVNGEVIVKWWHEYWILWESLFVYQTHILLRGVPSFCPSSSPVVLFMTTCKTLMTFHHTGFGIGIDIMAYSIEDNLAWTTGQSALMPCKLGILFRMIHRKTLWLVVSRLHLIFYPKPRSSCPMKLEVYVYSCISKSRCVCVYITCIYLYHQPGLPCKSPQTQHLKHQIQYLSRKEHLPIKVQKRHIKFWNSPSSAKPRGTSLECRRLALDQVGGVVIDAKMAHRLDPAKTL